MSLSLNEVDRVEILTLQGDYVDLISGDDTATVTRAKPLEGLAVKNSILAEHGFSTKAGRRDVVDSKLTMQTLLC